LLTPRRVCDRVKVNLEHASRVELIDISATKPLSKDEAQRIAGGLKALSEPVRVRLIDLVASQGEMCVCDLPGPLGIGQPTVSHHLKLLVEAGLLFRETRGRWAYYRVNEARLRELAASLTPATANA